MLPNHWQHAPSLLGQALPSVGAYSPPRTESTGTSHNDSIRHNPESSFPSAPSGRPSAPPKSHSSRRCRIFLREYHSELDICSQHCVTSRAATLTSSSETFSFDRRHSIAGFAPSSPRNLCCTDRVMDTIPTRDLPPISASASLAVRNSPTFPNSYREATANVQPRTSVFSATPAPYHWQDGGNEMWSANVSEAREKTKQLIDGWKEDAKGVLLFSGLFSAIVAAFLMESYKKLCQDFGGPGGPGTGTQSQAPPPPATSIIVVNIAWLLSLVLNIVSALCATLTLQWARRYTRLPSTSSDHEPVPRHIRSLRYGIVMTVTLLQPSVFLFLMGLVMFFFTINKTVAIVVAITVGIFGGVCLALTILACLDRNRRQYRTPFSRL